MKLKIVTVFLIGVLVGAVGCFGTMFGITYYFMNEFEDEVEPSASLESEQLSKSSSEVAKAKDIYERYVAIGNVALWQAASNMPEFASAHAQELLELTEHYKGDWNYSNAIHKAHLALGLVALKDGNIQVARDHLRKAGEISGSPQLDSFGPNMYLARELLKVGEREAVLLYLESVSKFWSLDVGRLSKWRSMINEGKIPSFGANLLY